MGRRRLLVGGAALALLAMTWWWSGMRREAPVDLPVVDASAEEMVTAYAAALGAHDCDVVVQLSTPAHASTARAWCAERSVEGGVRVEPCAPPVGDPSAADRCRAMAVLGTRDMGGFDGRDTPWFFSLVRDPDRGWRVDGGGTGP